MLHEISNIFGDCLDKCNELANLKCKNISNGVLVTVWQFHGHHSLTQHVSENFGELLCGERDFLIVDIAQRKLFLINLLVETITVSLDVCV